MSATSIPDSHLDLLEGPYVAILTTVAQHCRPENSVVWCAWDGEDVYVSTLETTRKVHNIRSNPWVTLTVVDPEDPYRWIDVRGHVEEMIPDHDFAIIDKLAKLYVGAETYYGGVAPESLRDKEPRIVVRIRPEDVVIYP